MANRKKPMKVIVGGMPRTSTVSITSALRQLGFMPYDYFVRLEHGHLSRWNRMLRDKCQGRQEPLDRDDLDRLTGNYDCISDAPCFFLVEELARAYPEAKILLNERDVTSWLGSIEKTLRFSFEADQRWIYRVMRFLDPTFTGPIMTCDELAATVMCDSDYSDKSKLEERFAEHYKSLSQFGKDRTLKYRIQEGWKPLCQFLDLPVPARLFPRENDTSHLLELGRQSSRKGLTNSVRNLVGGALLTLMVSITLARFWRLYVYVD